MMSCNPINRRDQYFFQLTFQSSQGVITTNLFARASGMYTYLDSFNGIQWVNKDWANGHSQGHSPESSLYLAGANNSDQTIMFELLDCLPWNGNTDLNPGGTGTGKFSGSAPSAFQNALINWALISIDGQTADAGTG